MCIRVDFVDLKDWYCNVPYILTGFKPVHVGLKFHDYYLSVPRDHPSAWCTWESMDGVITPHVVHSFEILTNNYDPCLITLLGEGHSIDRPLKMFLKEIVLHGTDAGLWKWKPHRVSCIGVVSSILQAMSVPVTAATSKTLFNQLKDLDGSMTKRIK